MSNQVPKSKIPDVPTPAGALTGGGGNLLSSIAPPAGLPNFITASSAAPVSQASVIKPQVLLPSVIKPPPAQAVSVIQAQALPTSVIQPVAISASINLVQMPSTSSEAENFSPAIPLSAGQMPSRSNESQDTAQSASTADLTPEMEKIGDIMPGSALFSWMKEAVSSRGILQKVAEKAKSSVDTMITTLDPQMKEYLKSGGDFYIVVASDKEVKVSPVREAFQTVLGQATVVGIAAQSDVTACQPVGYAAAYAAAKQRIAHIRSSQPEINNNIPIVALESFLHEAINDRWYEITLLILSQPSFGIELQVQSQSTPVPSVAVAHMKESTAADYPHLDTGYSVTVGQIMADNLKVPNTQWQEEMTGVSRREMLLLAARSLAGSYKKILAVSAAQS